MFKLMQYFARFQQIQGGFSGLPGWAKLILFVLALPGLAIAALAILLFGVSILALLLLTVPVYRVLSAVAGRTVQGSGNSDVWVETQDLQSILGGSEPAPANRRHIDVKIVE